MSSTKYGPFLEDWPEDLRLTLRRAVALVLGDAALCRSVNTLLSPAVFQVRVPVAVRPPALQAVVAFTQRLEDGALHGPIEALVLWPGLPPQDRGRLPHDEFGVLMNTVLGLHRQA